MSACTYLPDVKGWIDAFFNSAFTPEKITKLCDGTTERPNDRLSHMAGCAARLWLIGSRAGKADTRYADRAFFILDSMRAQAKRSPKWKLQFQAKFAFLEAYSILKQNNYSKITSEFDAGMKAIAGAVGRDRLLVVMENSSQATATRTYGCAQPPEPPWSKISPHALYAKETLRALRPVSFVTVMIPISEIDAAKAPALASRGRIERSNENSATVHIDGTMITLGESDAWSVSR